MTVHLLWRAPVTWAVGVAKVSTGLGFAIGIASSCFFIVLLLLGHNVLALVASEFFVFLILTVVSIISGAFANFLSSNKAPSSSHNPNWQTTLLIVVFVVCLIANLLAFYSLYRIHPHGEWDATMVWNLHAKFFDLGGTSWRRGFSDIIFWTQPSYPPLIPAFIARSWQYLGCESTLIPAATAFIFTFATVGALFGFSAIVGGRWQALMASITLLTTPYFTQLGSAQMADPAIALFFLITIACYALYDSGQGGKRLLVLAGMSLAWATLTKNDAWCLIFCLGIARFFALFTQGELKQFRQELLMIGSGAAPVWLVLAIYKLNITAGSSAPEIQLVLRRLTEERFLLAAKTFFMQLFGFGEWQLTCIPLLFAYWIAFGRNLSPQERLFVRTTCICLVLLVLAPLIENIVIFDDLGFFLRANVQRQYYQLWPAAIFAFYFATGELGARKQQDN
jgi:hypothetical protein